MNLTTFLSGYKTYIAAAGSLAGALVKAVAAVGALSTGDVTSAWSDGQAAYTAALGALALAGIRHAIAKNSPTPS